MLICLYIGYISFVLISGYVNRRHKMIRKKKKLKILKNQIEIDIIKSDENDTLSIQSDSTVNNQTKQRSNSSPANLSELLINESIKFQKVNKLLRNSNSSNDIYSMDQLKQNVILKRNLLFRNHYI